MTDEFGNVRLVRLTRGAFALVDEADFDEVSQYHWHLHLADDKMYARRYDAETGRYVYMHRQLLGLKAGDGLFADHINGLGLDNRRANLRVVDAAGHSQNSRLRRNNRSGYKGVFEYEGRWVAEIHHDGYRERLGYFDDPVRAALAYDEAARKYHGACACTNEQMGLLPEAA